MWILSDFFRCSGCDYGSAFVAPFRSYIDDVIGSFDDIQVVFDNDDGVAVSGEPPQDFGQFVDIGKVEAGCWFIQDVDCLSCAASAQFGRQFDPLGFTAR